ncbi:hypothetical protein BUALT_Bualt08G0089500 [Buddleja alternifolia]|uniref:Uncharacterized protein n=1 Tax=Buddleja alternifolia TaxID=168488 RepID=A0AAV6X632_9LAMI|nr:hypothetical protein BUALT_Bualt08G0089500 [Buddleja alternifolia]
MGNREFPIIGPITANYTTRCEGFSHSFFFFYLHLKGMIPVLLPLILILLGIATPRFSQAIWELKRRKVKPERFGLDGELENKARLARFGSSLKLIQPRKMIIKEKLGQSLTDAHFNLLSRL